MCPRPSQNWIKAILIVFVCCDTQDVVFDKIFDNLLTLNLLILYISYFDHIYYFYLSLQIYVKYMTYPHYKIILLE